MTVSSPLSHEEVVRLYHANFLEGKLSQFRVDGIDRLGLPVWIAGMTLPDGTLLDGYGYGATPDEAAVGAYGELSEQIHSTASMQRRKPVFGSYAELARERGKTGVVDPLTLCLPAGSEYRPDMQLAWAEAVRHSSGETVLVPWEFAAVSFGQMRGRPPLITPITNGLGAGDTLARALSHGLLELLQRDGNCVSFRAMDRGIVVELDEITDDVLAGLLDTLRELGVEVTVKLAASDFGMPNLYVVGHDVDEWPGALPIQATACGEAIHPDRERCLRKALLEFAAARTRKGYMHGPLELIRRVAPEGHLDTYAESFDPANEEPRCLAAMMEWMEATREELIDRLSGSVLRDSCRVKLSDLPSTGPVGTPEELLTIVSGRLRSEGFDILYFDFSPPSRELAVVKVVVPGLECETMSYYRIGERGLGRLMERGCDFVGFGSGPTGALPVRLTEEARERLGDQAWLDPRAVDRIVGPLYPLYREPNSHAAAIAKERHFIPVLKAT